MARHDDRYGVSGTGASDGTDGAGFAERFGDLRVCARGPAGYLLEFLPDPALERGGLDVERQIDARSIAFHATNDFLEPGSVAGRGRNNVGIGIFFAEFAGAGVMEWQGM